MEVSISEGPPGEAGAPGQGEGGKTGAGDGEDSREQPEWSEDGPAEWDGEEEGVAHPATWIGSRYGADLTKKNIYSVARFYHNSLGNHKYNT